MAITEWKGDNVTEKSARMPWYAGPTLMDHLETVEVGRELVGLINQHGALAVGLSGEDAGQIYWTSDLADDALSRRGGWNDVLAEGYTVIGQN